MSRRWPALPTNGLGHPGRNGDRGRDRAAVRWIGGPSPDALDARAIFEAIHERGLTTARDVAAELARVLYWRDIWSGAWATDIGLLRGLYLREARRIIEQLDGTLVRIG